MMIYIYEICKKMWKLIFNEIRLVLCYMSVTSSTADILNNEKTQIYWHADNGGKTDSFYLCSCNLYIVCKMLS